MRVPAWGILISIGVLPVIASDAGRLPTTELFHIDQNILRHRGETAVIAGTVNVVPSRATDGTVIASIQDQSGGALLYGAAVVLRPSAFQIGDVVEARGVVGDFRGIPGLQVQQIRKITVAEPPVAVRISVAQLNQGFAAGRLVYVSGHLVFNGGHLLLQDSSGAIPIRLTPRFYKDAAFLKRLYEGGNAKITGIDRPWQRNGSRPHTEYGIYPRTEADFVFAPVFFRPEIMLGGLAALVLLAYNWHRRRSAEQRAQELAKLSETLAASEHRFRQMAESIDEAFWIQDLPTGKTLYLSPAFEKIWGLPVERVYEDHLAFLDLVHKEDRAAVEAHLARQTSSPGELTYRIIRPDGNTRWIQDRAYPVVDQAGTVYRLAGVTADITQKRELQEQLSQAQKMEAIGRLAGGVAHDFNNLLTVISGYARMLRGSIPEGSDEGDWADEIGNAADQAAKLTEQLLTFSRRRIPQPAVLDLNDLITGLSKMLRRLIGEDVAMELNLDPGIGKIKADPGQMSQIIMNLAVNARDAMPHGGMLWIETATITVDRAQIGSPLDLACGQYVLLRVRDTGCGIDPVIRDFIFEPFFTTKEAGKGTGLGLATVYGVIKQAGGGITVDSGHGQGTTFTVYLPTTDEEAPALFTDDVPLPVEADSRIILLVEDADNVRRLTEGILKQKGYRVISARDPDEALALSERLGFRFDLLLTDVVMPHMNGCDLARRLRSRFPGVKTLYMSGYSGDALQASTTIPADSRLIRKPFTREKLLDRITEALNSPM